MFAFKSCAVFAFCWGVVKRVVSCVAICQLATTVLGGGLDKQPTFFVVEESTKGCSWHPGHRGNQHEEGVLGVGLAGVMREGEAPPGGRREYIPVGSGPVPYWASPREEPLPRTSRRRLRRRARGAVAGPGLRL